jgi:hypothetical protein
MARTQAVLDNIVAALQVNCGDLFAACRTNGVSLIFVRQWMKDDKIVADAITEAERVGVMGLQSEAIRRAVEGVDKGVYFKGELVDTEKVYSDGLLQTLLKGRISETYGKEAEGGGNTFNGPTQINIMPRANNYDEWLAMKASTLAQREEMPSLPAPAKVIEYIEAEAIPVPVNALEGLGL